MGLRQILPVVGAAVGGYYGGAQGAQIGWGVGSIAGSAIDPKVVRGPRLGDIASQTSQEGVSRPIVFGTSPPITGNIIATSPPMIITTKKRQGKGGPVLETQAIHRTYAIRACEGTIAGFLRIWRNGKLVYDVSENSLLSDDDNKLFQEKARFFYGTFDQTASADLEAIFGVGTTCAHRGTAYLLMADEDLTDFGGAIPQWSFQVVSGDAPDRTVVLDDAVQVSPGDPIGLTWECPEDPSSWILLRRVDGGSWDTLEASLAGALREYSDVTAYTDGQTIEYYVTGVFGASSVDSNIVSIDWEGAAPITITLTMEGQSSPGDPVDLSWVTSSPTDPDYWRIYRDTGGGFISIAGEISGSLRTFADSDTFSDGQSLSYYVEGGFDGDAVDSNTVSIDWAEGDGGGGGDCEHPGFFGSIHGTHDEFSQTGRTTGSFPDDVTEGSIESEDWAMTCNPVFLYLDNRFNGVHVMTIAVQDDLVEGSNSTERNAWLAAQFDSIDYTVAGVDTENIPSSYFKDTNSTVGSSPTFRLFSTNVSNSTGWPDIGSDGADITWIATVVPNA